MVAFLPNITRPVHGLLASSALSITRWIRGRKKWGRPPYTDSTFGFSVAAEPRLCCGNPAASPAYLAVRTGIVLQCGDAAGLPQQRRGSAATLNPNVESVYGGLPHFSSRVSIG